jgi:hypothetical protein
MVYGSNLLSTTPAKWTLVNGTMTAALITLNTGGTATLLLDYTDIISIPESFLLTLITNKYTKPYAADMYAVLYVETLTGSIYEYSVPIVDVRNGICTIEIPTIAVDYTKFVFSIRTAQPVTISAWSLSAPSVDAVDLTEVEAKIQKLLADYNTSQYAVGQVEETIALISARLTDNTDVSGHLQLTYIASANCTITLRFKDNDGTELFAPLLYDVVAGRGSIGVPHAYLRRLLGLHTFSVTAQCSAGLLTFNTRSILYTIDAGYLATRLMDVSTDIQDLALQQLSTDNSPSSIYAVGIDTDGVARVRHRAYSENAAIVWTPVFQYEASISAAIEFNGIWRRRVGNQFFTLECEADPWVFWVTVGGALKCQKGSDTDTLVTLATGVSMVRAVRGFKSELYLAQDQGLVAVYLKNGTAYYRNYCVQEDGTTIWEPERALTALGSGLTSVHAHRLNDYRLGFVGSSPAGNKWLITKRTYIAAAALPEYINFQHYEMTTMAVLPVNDATYDLTVTTEISADHMDLYVNSVHPILIRTNFMDAFTISSTVPLSIKSMSTYGSRIHIELDEYVASALLTLTPISDNVVAYLENKGHVRLTSPWVFEIVGRAYTEEAIAFTPNLLSGNITQKYLDTLYGYYPEELNFTFNVAAASIVQRALTTAYGYTDELITFTCNVTISSMTVSFVGTEPI